LLAVLFSIIAKLLWLSPVPSESHTFFCQEGNAAVLLSDRKCVFLKVISAASALPRLLSTNAAADVMNN